MIAGIIFLIILAAIPFAILGLVKLVDCVFGINHDV